MKVGGNGRGGLHCGGQPHVERELGGLGPSSEQDEQQHDGLHTGIELGDRAQRERAGSGEQEGRADVESQSADMGDDERLHTGLLGRGRHVVADEAPGAHTGDLEENELADDGGAVGETGHGADERGEVHVEATTGRVGMLLILIAHVRERIDDDEQADSDERGCEQRAHPVEYEAHDQGLAHTRPGYIDRVHAVSGKRRGQANGSDRGDAAGKGADPFSVGTRQHDDEQGAQHGDGDRHHGKEGQARFD